MSTKETTKEDSKKEHAGNEKNGGEKEKHSGKTLGYNEMLEGLGKRKAALEGWEEGTHLVQKDGTLYKQIGPDRLDLYQPTGDELLATNWRIL
jgi:hypothetical protein